MQGVPIGAIWKQMHVIDLASILPSDRLFHNIKGFGFGLSACKQWHATNKFFVFTSGQVSNHYYPFYTLSRYLWANYPPPIWASSPGYGCGSEQPVLCPALVKKRGKGGFAPCQYGWEASVHQASEHATTQITQNPATATASDVCGPLYYI